MYPSHPLGRGSDESTCISCSSRDVCCCEMATSDCILRPLVELYKYHIKGVGIRALQSIPAGAFLDEYVGVIRSADYKNDRIYAYSVIRHGCTGDEFIATISAKKYGNWTCFIDHSCRASTRFVERGLGDKRRVLVAAIRDIAMFEEITIDYGPDYWYGRKCRCDESECVTAKRERVLQGRSNDLRGSLKSYTDKG